MKNLNIKKPIALCSGINGQDGSYLAEFLLEKGYEVHGIIRRSSSFNTQRIEHIFDQLHLHYGDVTDALSIDQIIHKIKPDEIYHLAAQSHVKVSFDVPGYTAQTDAIGTLNMLEAIRKHCPNTRFYNAATSELFGKVQEVPQKETTPFYPRSPYGVAKIYAFWIVKNYREAYNIFACNGILFNHESERRGSTFVTAKIVNGLIDYLETGKTLYLGNLNAKRDWGYAAEYVECMWRMLQQDEPEDFVIGTGETHTIKEFINECLNYLPKNKFQWKKDEKERDILWDMKEWKEIIGIDEKYYRASEVDLLLADSTKAKEKLGWTPKIKFKELVKIMMIHRINIGRI
jgi:GDPmannose 4,6-dehydratase